ncbi:hypothetical protein V6N13_007607 [Hibiscus sabdariffa]
MSIASLVVLLDRDLVLRAAGDIGAGSYYYGEGILHATEGLSRCNLMVALVQGSATTVLGPVVCLLFYDGTRSVSTGVSRCIGMMDLEQGSAIQILVGLDAYLS